MILGNLFFKILESKELFIGLILGVVYGAIIGGVAEFRFFTKASSEEFAISVGLAGVRFVQAVVDAAEHSVAGKACGCAAAVDQA